MKLITRSPQRPFSPCGWRVELPLISVNRGRLASKLKKRKKKGVKSRFSQTITCFYSLAGGDGDPEGITPTDSDDERE